MPSSKISRAFSESLVPPMSLTWPTVPTRPTSRPSRNTGVSTAMSNRCPAHSHGSLVTSTSPSLQRLGRILGEQRLHGTRQAEIEHRHGARRMHQRLAARVEQLAGEVLRFRDDQRERGADHGQPHLLDHGDEPAPHDLERDRVGLDAAHRLGEPHARRHQCVRRRRDADGEPQVEALIHRQDVAGRHDGGGLALLDDGRTFDAVTRRQRVAVVDCCLDKAAEPSLPRALALVRCRAVGSSLQRQCRSRARARVRGS